MSIQPISNATAAATTPATTASPTVNLGMGGLTSASFLQLLTVQLKNQDPTNPMDPTAMMSQLAQFTSLQQSQELNTLQTSAQQQNMVTQGASMVGKNLNVTLQNGSTVSGTVQQVVWSHGTMAMQINGTQYPMTSVTAINATTN